jgi:hypothetical protein
VIPLFNRKYHPLALIIIGLGLFGLIAMMINNPLELLKMVAIGAAILGIFVFLYRRFTRKRDGGDGSSYQRAAKQSAKKYKKQKPRQTRRPSHLKVINSSPLLAKKRKEDPSEKRKNDHGLTVIDGKKRKKKNRALF